MIRRYSLEMRQAENAYSGYESRNSISAEAQRALLTFQQTFVVTDATQPDCPIMFASACFLAMTGYSHGEIIGRNCRFLQGPDTDRYEVARIREALRSERNFSGCLLNYKKDGTPFWNLLTITPIRDLHDRVIMCIGMQVEVSQHTGGCREQALRPSGLPASLIRYDSRQSDQAADVVTEIVGAFSKVPLSVASQAVVDGSHPNLLVNSKSHHGFYPGHSNQNLRAAEACPEAKLDPQLRNRRRRRRRRNPGLRLMSLLGLTSKASGVQSRDERDGATEVSTSIGDTNNAAARNLAIRRAFDLATSLERIEKNFVITDPRLPDNPIIFASNQFLELTEYAREDVLGRNCRFLQGPETDPVAVRQIRDAIAECRHISVQLLNYTKSGKPFWSLLHLHAVHDPKGELQYFIGVQQNPQGRLSEITERDRAELAQQAAIAIDDAVRELPDANLSPERLWAMHSKPVFPKPRMQQGSPAWAAILTATSKGLKLGLKHFRPIQPLGCGDTGSVHLVELRGTGLVFAMKAMDKAALMRRNKVHRACTERQILELLDHPFLPTLYASFQTATHVCLIMNFCPGRELYLALEQQPQKHFREDSARFYAAEIVIALEYLHCLGVVYRDLKPENILIQDDGHVQLTDFDLSVNSSANLPMIGTPDLNTRGKTSLTKRKSRRRPKIVQHPVFVAEPVASCNSFVGTEEYIAPEIITGHGHGSAVDWWSLGILLYEMLFGRTPFKGCNRQKTFANILTKDLSLPPSIPVSLEARQLIQGLLARDPVSRLGSTLGAHDIKTHPFFRNLKWPLVRCMTPPPLEVPVHFMEPMADFVPDSAHFEWDNEEASSPVCGAF
uniref:non-specific serine/threonine protein kinase n=2 Tax=Pulvigera lyellii TaxID=61563 RepID=A0A126WVK5_9BRYO|nr:putative LOV domain-containing protein [Pulvigera lyellii]